MNREELSNDFYMIGNSHIGEILELNDNTILHQSDNISKILGAEINH